MNLCVESTHLFMFYIYFFHILNVHGFHMDFTTVIQIIKIKWNKNSHFNWKKM